MPAQLMVFDADRKRSVPEPPDYMVVEKDGEQLLITTRSDAVPPETAGKKAFLWTQRTQNHLSRVRGGSSHTNIVVSIPGDHSQYQSIMDGIAATLGIPERHDLLASGSIVGLLYEKSPKNWVFVAMPLSP